jgi:signal transduction histidine kinase
MPRNTEIFHPTFSGESIIRLEDVTKDRRFGKNAPYYGLPEGHLPVRSYLAAPVVARSGEVIGGLFFGHEEAGVFTERSGRIIESITAQAAIAIENARLYTGMHSELTERRRAQEELRELTETLEERVKDRTAKLEEANINLKHQIEERSRAERRLELANAALLASNRELQDFAYVASHDLQEPLRKIKTFGDLLRIEGSENLDRQSADYLDRMQSSASRMTDLISGLLEYSRIKTRGQPFECIDLNEVMDSVLSDLEVSVQESNARIEVDSLPEIEADPVQMRQLFQNLISNALKFRKADMAPHVRISAAQEKDGLWCLTFRDNGIGFESEHAERIFSPFQRLHSRGDYEGTGMGLAICRRIVERHNGRIDAEGRLGEGATFVVHLPSVPFK